MKYATFMIAVCLSIFFASSQAGAQTSLDRFFIFDHSSHESEVSGLLVKSGAKSISRGSGLSQGMNRYGGWGGFSIGWFFPDLSGFRGMTEDRGLDGFDEPLRMWQGRGILNINNFLIGGMGGGGAFYEVESINGDDRWASLDILYGGFYMGYLLPVTYNLGIFGGVTLGGGMAWMGADGDDLGDYWSQFESFDYTAPEAGISIKVTNWFKIEGTAQYNMFGLDTHGSSFRAANGEEMVDLDSLSGPSYSLRFMFGYDG